MIRLGLTGRILLLALAPVVGIALVLSTYFIHNQLRSLDHTLNDRGETLARHLAGASEYGVFSGNREILQALARSTLNEDDVVAVTITDRLGAPLVQLPPQATPPAPLDAQVRVFSQPIEPQTLPPLNEEAPFFDEPAASPEPLGWVVVTLSLDRLAAAKNAQITNSVLITLFGLLLTLFLAARLSRRLTRPLSQLHRAAEAIQHGDLTVEVKPQSTGELRTLEEAFRSMAASLRSRRDDLQRQIDQATAGLRESLDLVEKQNRALGEARQQALAASRTKSTFLANMSHELRTPLNGILGFTRLLHKTRLDTEQKDYVETIERSADELLHLLNDILDLSRVEAGKLSLQRRACNLREVVDEALTLLAPGAFAKGLELVDLFYRDVPEAVITDPDRVRQILLNLVGNAIKFSPSGTIAVRSMLEEEDAQEVLLRVTVSDQGVGIPPAAQARLFQSFEQLDDASTRLQTGAGLGLAICKSLVHLLGGEIGVESEAGQGATFWFTLPCRKVAAGTQSPLRLAGQRALVCEANDLSGLALSHVLEGAGCQVDRCQAAEMLLPRLRQATGVDIIAIGLQVRDTATLDAVAAALAQRPAGSTARVLLLVDSVEPQTLAHLRRRLGYPCLPKPVRRREILAALDAPAGEPAAVNQAAPTPTETNAGRADTDLSGYRILVAEDNPINARLLDLELGRLGASIRLVGNGQEAVATVAAGGIDLVLMDVQMPILNGIDASRAIRAAETDGHRLPIIGLTASLLASEQNACLGAGIDTLLSKPVETNGLARLIRELCGRAPARSSHASSTRPKLDRRPLKAMLLAEMPTVEQTMREAEAAGDWTRLGEITHRFLGGVSYCDVPPLRDALRELYGAIKQGHEENLGPLLTQVYAEMDSLQRQSAEARQASA